MKLPKRIFVTGTSTDIGKTVVSGILVAGLAAHYWKPIQTGLIDGTDSDWIRRHVGTENVHKETYLLQEPLSPHAAAALEDVEIELAAFSLPAVPAEQTLIVEGAGGILVPINQTHYMIDLIQMLRIPVVIVADSRLGTINHTLLTLRQLREQQIPIVGVVMNGVKNAGNRDAIESYGDVEVLAEIEPLTELTPSSLTACFARCFS